MSQSAAPANLNIRVFTQSGSKAAQPTLNADFRFTPERGQAAAVDAPNVEMSYRWPPLRSFTFDPVSQRSPLVVRSGGPQEGSAGAGPPHRRRV